MEEIEDINNDQINKINKINITNILESIFEYYGSSSAMVFENTKMTYRELSNQINKLTHYLVSICDIKPNQPIGFCMNRGFNNIIAMLAILKIGCFYVPVDKKNPIGKNEHIIKDTRIGFLITDIDDANDESILNVLSKYTNILNINIIDEKFNGNTCPNNSALNELAYIIYTSGTTGPPKGVVINQDGLLNLIRSAIRILDIKQRTKIYQYAPMGFDAAGWDIYISLLSGSTLYIANDNLMVSPLDCHTYLKDNQINMLTVTPSFLAGFPLEQINSLNTLIVMGDMADAKNMNFWCKDRRTYNGYGPTETTIGATLHLYSVGDSPANIGKPFDGYTIHILNENHESIESSGCGEMYIGGIGVAKEYWNNDEATKKKFVETKYGRLYKTGDIARLMNNGEYEFVGRIDNQIKINGVRIELEEIETLMTQVSFVIRASVKCIMIKEKKTLIAYYTSNDMSEDQVKQDFQIKEHLEKNLVRAVVPQRYQRVEKFLLTPSGKVNKDTLPEYVKTNRPIVVPTSETEKIIICAYKKALQINEDIGINANYFEYGGDSITTSRVVSYLKRHNLCVQAIQIMQNPIIAHLTKYVKPIMERSMKISGKKRMIMDNRYIALSPHQMSLWHYQIMYPNDPSYNTLVAYSFDNSLCPNRLINALQSIVNIHEALRTRINVVNDVPIQNFPENTLKIEIDMITESTNLNEKIKSLMKIPFKMINTDLMRIKLYKISSGYVLVIIKHNIITDAFSEGILLEELQNAYNNQITSDIGDCAFTYSDYIDDVTNRFEDKSMLEYWNTQLKDYVQLSLPKSLPKSLNESRSIIKSVHLPNFKEFISDASTTAFKFLLTGLNILFHRYNQYNTNKTSDISIGTQIANRDNSDWSDTVGFMIATLIVRNQFDNNITVSDLLKQVTTTLNDVSQHQYVTYDQQLKIIQGKIDVMFVMQTAPNSKHLALTGTDAKRIELELTSDAFPIYIDVYPNGDEFKFHIRYSNDYSTELMHQLFNSYQYILNDMMNNEKFYDSISKIKYLGQDEIQIITGPYIKSNDETLTYAITKQALIRRSEKAMYYSSGDSDHLNTSMTYNRLLAETNKTARCLMEKYKIKEGSVVGVKMRRSKNFVIMLISILKTGACYVPIDPDYPNDRISYMIDDCKPTLIVQTAAPHIDNSMIISYDTIRQEAQSFSTDDIDFSKAESIAYIIYTSGSTGNPKGCMITHKAIINILNHFKSELKVTPSDKIWSLTTISFDIMVLEIFLPLISGAQLLICPHCIASDPVLLVNWINDHQPTILQATPTQFSIIGNHLKINKNMTILVGGEAVSSKLAECLSNVTPNLYNVYGPSETTVWSTMKKITNPNQITIGTPISNTTCIVLTNDQQPTPFGCVGELCIGGIGLAKGYFNREILTKEKFITLSNEKKFYRTGDLVKLITTSNGTEIEYIGRSDFQLKIRGHRIELGEIISVMEQHPSVKRATLITKEHEDSTFLVAYYTGQETSELIEYLQSKLPVYMVPHFTILLPRFPETLNNKIDVNKLPNPFNPEENKHMTFVRSGEYVAPQTPLEKQIHDIYVQIIGGPSEITTIDSPLNLGASSLHCTRIVGKLNNVFNKEISMAQFLKNSSIVACAKLIQYL